MCFTPAVSLVTALFEFCVAFYLLNQKQTKLKRYLTTFVIILGLYQLSEFFMCVFGPPFLWARVGFLVNTLLPAMALFAVISFRRVRLWHWLVFIPLIVFELIALITPNFILVGACHTVFVSVSTVLYSGGLSTLYYMIYYFSYILLSLALIVFALRKEKRKNWRYILSILFFSSFIALFGALILFVLFPVFDVKFPSLYCEFAALYGLAALFAARFENQ